MSLKKNILDTIRNKHIEPIPFGVIKRKKYLMTIFFGFLIGLGIFIVSFFISDASGVIEFVEIDTLYILFSWVIAILGLGIFIYKDSKNVGTLYRYSMTCIISSIFITIIFGGVLLHLSGIDISIQKYLIKHTGYENLMSTFKYWDNPQHGRLIGEITEIGSGRLIIEDNRDIFWNVMLPKRVMSAQLNTTNQTDLNIGNTIKISGVFEGDNNFTATGISVLFE